MSVWAIQTDDDYLFNSILLLIISWMVMECQMHSQTAVYHLQTLTYFMFS